MANRAEAILDDMPSRVARLVTEILPGTLVYIYLGSAGNAACCGGGGPLQWLFPDRSAGRRSSVD